MPGACQSRDPARPQARIPRTVTKKEQLTISELFLLHNLSGINGLFLYLLCNDDESPVLRVICAGREGEQLISGLIRTPVSYSLFLSINLAYSAKDFFVAAGVFVVPEALLAIGRQFGLYCGDDLVGLFSYIVSKLMYLCCL